MIKDLWEGPRYTDDELMARLKFFVGVILSLTLFGIVFVVLYSLIFVTQPMNGMSPVDNKFFELIIPIATFLTGTLSGIMLASGDKDAQREALKAANKGWDKPPTPPPMPTPTVTFSGGSVPVSMTTNNGQVTVGFNGKLAPPPAPQPEL